MECPCNICIVDAICDKACNNLREYLVKFDLRIMPVIKKIPEDLPKNKRLAYRVGKLPGYFLSEKAVLLLRDHFDNFDYGDRYDYK